jgi:hypothetical protein
VAAVTCGGGLILAKFVTPVLAIFRVVGPRTTKRFIAVLQVYARACTGFEPEAYEAAALMMATGRKNPFPPTPAECREWLEKGRTSSMQQGCLVRTQKSLSNAIRHAGLR